MNLFYVGYVMSVAKLKYGLRNGVLIHIDNVVSGKACGCQCPSCNAPLIARKGDRRENHFAHEGLTCKYAFETVLHMLAKQIIDNSKSIILPRVSLSFSSNRADLEVFDERTLDIDFVELEVNEDGFVPDVIIYKGQHRLLVEIYVTHKVNSAKKQLLQEKKLSCIEINLSKEPRDLDIETLTELIVYRTDNKQWIYNNKVTQLREKLERLAVEKNIQWSANKYASGSERKHLVDDCPLRIHSNKRDTRADAMWECLYCRCCINFIESSVFCVESLAHDNDLSQSNI